MNPQTIEVYDWYKDIQPELCNILGIEVKDFRDYHNVIGCDDNIDYKDLWHVWLSIDEYVRNDSYSTVWCWTGNNEHWSEQTYLCDKIKDEYGVWALVLLEAVEEMFKKLNKDKIVIWYSW